MPNKAAYCEILKQKPEAEWTAYLLSESGLPGPRGNLELAQAAADCARREQFLEWLRLSADQTDSNRPDVFLAVCGAVGLGRLAAEGDWEQLSRLRELSNDPRWRVREGAAMALQRVGMANMPLLLGTGLEWSRGSLLEARAAAAGVCEPALLRDSAHAGTVFAILDNATHTLAEALYRRGDDFAALRKGLGYCWSVAVAAYPKAGKTAFEGWLGSTDRDVRWVLRENLKKDRLSRMDMEWVHKTQQSFE